MATVLVLLFSIGLLAGLITLIPSSSFPGEGRKNSFSQTDGKQVSVSEKANY